VQRGVLVFGQCPIEVALLRLLVSREERQLLQRRAKTEASRRALDAEMDVAHYSLQIVQNLCDHPL
jgi:hypothetical protein